MRDAKRMSLRDVEKKTGISNPYMSQLENELIDKPSPLILHKLAMLYGVEYDYLMQKAGYFVPANADESSSRHVSRSFALSSMKDLTPSEEEALVEYLAFLRTRRKRRKQA
jgi:transcriptional regulator with XRE-family HTH domain